MTIPWTSKSASFIYVRAWLCAVGLVATLCSCLGVREPVPWPEGDYLRVFLVEVRSDRSMPTVLAAWSSGQQRELSTAINGDTELFIVGLTEDDIRPLHPDVVLDAPERIELDANPDAEVGSADCRVLGVLGSDNSIEWTLDQRGDIFRLEGEAWVTTEAPASLADLGLRIPVRESCSSVRLSGRPFAGESPYFLPEDGLGDDNFGTRAIDHVVPLDSERMLAVTENAILIVRQGQAYINDQSLQWLSRSMGTAEGRRWELEYAFPVRSPSTGTVESVLVGATLRDTARQEAAGWGLFEVDFSEAGFGESRVIAQHEESSVDMESMSVGPRGEYIMLADHFVVTATSHDSVPEIVESPPFEAQSLAYDPAASPPQVLGGAQGSIWVGDLFSEQRLTLENTGFPSSVRTVELVDGVPHAGLEVPPLLRRLSGTWTPLPLYLPPSFASCAEQPRCGRLEVGPHRLEVITGLEDGSGRFLIAAQSCPGILLVEPRPIEACVLGWTMDWSELSSDPHPGVDDLQMFEGNGVVAGNGGLLYEIVIDE